MVLFSTEKSTLRYFFQQSTPSAKVKTLEMCVKKKNGVPAPPGLEPTISGSKQKRLRPVGHEGLSRQAANLLILNDTCALSVINILFSKENGYLMLLSS